MFEWVLLAHAAATWFMVGLIWFVQIVHYPLFAAVGPNECVPYAHRHQARTTWVVGPVMLVELTTALLLLRDGAARADLAWLGVALLAIVWTSTVVLQVPRHRRLAVAHDTAAVRGLVATNWARTLAWTARGAVALALLAT